MDLDDTPEQAAYRTKVRAWLEDHSAEAPMLDAYEATGEDFGEDLGDDQMIAARRVWQGKLAEGAPALRRALARLAWRDSFDSGTPIEQLRFAAWKLIEWRDHPAPWRQIAFDREPRIDQLIEQVKLVAEAASRCPKPSDNLVRSLRPAQGVVTWIARAEAATCSRDYDTLESLLVKLLRDLKKDSKKGSGFFSSTVPREQLVEARTQLIQNLESFQIAADADLASLLRGDASRSVVGSTRSSLSPCDQATSCVCTSVVWSPSLRTIRVMLRCPGAISTRIGLTESDPAHAPDAARRAAASSTAQPRKRTTDPASTSRSGQYVTVTVIAVSAKLPTARLLWPLGTRP